MALIFCLVPFSVSAQTEYEFTTSNGWINEPIENGVYFMSIYDYQGTDLLYSGEFDTASEECFMLYIPLPFFDSGDIFVCFYDEWFSLEMFGFTPEDETQELVVVLTKVGGEVLPFDTILQFWNDMSDILADNIPNLQGLFYYNVYGDVQPTALGIILCSLLAIPFCLLAFWVIALMCRPRK